MKKLQKNCVKVLTRLAKLCEEDEDFAEAFSEDLETWLNELQAQDTFGTEGQTDPRGDFRNGKWSIKKIEA